MIANWLDWNSRNGFSSVLESRSWGWRCGDGHDVSFRSCGGKPVLGLSSRFSWSAVLCLVSACVHTAFLLGCVCLHFSLHLKTPVTVFELTPSPAKFILIWLHLQRPYQHIFWGAYLAQRVKLNILLMLAQKNFWGVSDRPHPLNLPFHQAVGKWTFQCFASWWCSVVAVTVYCCLLTHTSPVSTKPSCTSLYSLYMWSGPGQF